MPIITSHCDCGAVQLDYKLPKSIENYTPRACDCDFCLSHNIHYLSDVAGNLLIKTDQRLHPIQQGSEQATFWQCASCNNIVAVTCILHNTLRGAANAQIFRKHHQLASPVVVSPKQLSAKEKTGRWGELWSRVCISTGND